MTPDTRSPPSALAHVAHIRALHTRISSIKESIREELKRPSPDYLRLTRLKKQKVRLKDGVRRLLLTPADAPVSRPSNHKVFRS